MYTPANPEFQQKGWMLRAVVSNATSRILDQMNIVQEDLPAITVNMDWFGSRGFVLDVLTVDELPIWCRGLVQNLPPAYADKPIRMVTAMQSSRYEDGSRGGLLEVSFSSADYYDQGLGDLKISAHSVQHYGKPAGVEISSFRTGELVANSDNILVSVQSLSIAGIDVIRTLRLAAQIPSDLLDLFQTKRADVYTQRGHAYSSFGWESTPVYTRTA